MPVIDHLMQPNFQIKIALISPNQPAALELESYRVYGTQPYQLSYSSLSR